MKLRRYHEKAATGSLPPVTGAHTSGYSVSGHSFVKLQRTQRERNVLSYNLFKDSIFIAKIQEMRNLGINFLQVKGSTLLLFAKRYGIVTVFRCPKCLSNDPRTN